MKPSNRLEIIGILSLSLMLTSTFAISSCLPEMMDTFSEYSRSSIEFLVSASTISVICMIALTPILSRYLSERFMVATGLIMYGLFGTAPFFLTSYPLILASRILMGLGVGMVNAKAVSMIGERFSGELRSKLMGLRCSMETIGQTVLMLLVGRLLHFGWHYPFLIYTASFLILIVYLAFVPAKKAELPADPLSSGASEAGRRTRTRISKKDGIVILFYVLMGFTLVSASSVNNLRITTYIVETGIGEAADGATILSIAVFFGFLGGLVFGKLMEKLGHLVLPLVLFGVSVGMVSIGLAEHLAVIAFGACVCNFCITLGTSYLFNGLSEQVSAEALGIGNSILLVGCNLGACTISFVLQAISLINSELTTGFFFYAILYLILTFIFLFKKRGTSA